MNGGSHAERETGRLPCGENGEECGEPVLPQKFFLVQLMKDHVNSHQNTCEFTPKHEERNRAKREEQHLVMHTFTSDHSHAREVDRVGSALIRSQSMDHAFFQR